MSGRLPLPAFQYQPINTQAVRQNIMNAWQGLVKSGDHNFIDQFNAKNQAAQGAQAKSAGDAANASAAQASLNAKDLSTPASGAAMGPGAGMDAQQMHPNDMPGMNQMSAGLNSVPAPSPFTNPLPPVDVVSGAPGMAMMSDETQKTDIKSKAKEVQKMLDGLKAYSFKYKKPELPGANADENVGIMAQDLQKSKLGKTAVYQGPDAKMVNQSKEVQLAMAALAHLNSRMNKLEGKK